MVPVVLHVLEAEQASREVVATACEQALDGEIPDDARGWVTWRQAINREQMARLEEALAASRLLATAPWARPTLREASGVGRVQCLLKLGRRHEAPAGAAGDAANATDSHIAEWVEGRLAGLGR